MFFGKITVLGVGLMGASFALAMRKRRLCDHIAGYGRRESNLIRAKEMGIIDSFSLDPAEACEDSDLVVFSMPLGDFIGTAERIRDSVKEGAVVTDVGSVKGSLVYALEKIFSHRASFVGSHPIAGSEKSGIETADGDLFKGSRCIITPTEKTDEKAAEAVGKLWQSLGAEVSVMSPEEHDRVFGIVSHLPHVIAYEIVNTADEIDGSYLAFSGKGFRDITRIAASSPEVWRDICMFNRENLVHFIDVFVGKLEKVREYLVQSDAESLEKEFQKAKTLRDACGQD